MNKFMKTAILEARKSENDIPAGTVIVLNNEIIATSHNMREINNDITAHSEILALKQAEKVLNNWRLNDCDIYVTLEPCPMCGWAILQSKIRNIYFGSYNLNYGAFSKCNLDKITQSGTKIYGGIMETECSKLLDDYFKKIRSDKNN